MNWVARTKQWTARSLQNYCTQGPGVHFCARVQDRELALGHRHRARILAWVCLKKECVHIGAQWVPYLDTVTGYHVWTLPKWMNVTKVSQKSKVTHPNKFHKQLPGLIRKTTKLNIRRLLCLLGKKRPTKIVLKTIRTFAWINLSAPPLLAIFLTPSGHFSLQWIKNKQTRN